MLHDWQGAGLRLPSVARTGRLLVLERRLVQFVLGELSPTDLVRVDRALSEVLGLS